MDQLPSILACDVGNSAIHFAAVTGDEVGSVQRMRIGSLGGLGEALSGLWQSMDNPDKLVACSVSDAGLKALEAAAAETLKQPVAVIGRDLPLPIDTDLPQAESVGVDRLCAAAAAFDKLGVACVVADFGSAITIDCVNGEGVFLGGAILPGLEVGARSLAAETAQLPQVQPVVPDWVFGKDTRQAIIGGLVFGARGALRELAESYATELGRWPIVIITGGDATLICPNVGESGLVRAHVADLVLRGAAIAYYKTLLK